jgi:hypothetical protein
MSTVDLRQISNALCSAINETSDTAIFEEYLGSIASGEFTEITSDLEQLVDDLAEAELPSLAERVRNILKNGHARIELSVEGELDQFWGDLRTDVALGAAMVRELAAAGFEIKGTGT